MPESRILAVDHVDMQACGGCEEALRWFYHKFIGLDMVDEPWESPPFLRFRSAELELRYALVSQPQIEEIGHRVTLLVDSLLETRKVLDEAGMPYLPITGVTYTDRRLSLLDPGGNRIALRQAWRPVF